MGSLRVCALIVLLSVALGRDSKLKYKPSNKPVRLFTEDELKKYDGSEVSKQT